MPPKQPNDACYPTSSNYMDYQLSSGQLSSDDLHDISVDEILLKYQDNSQLLNDILAAKAQEDKKRTAEEWRQAEEARLQSKFIEYELRQNYEARSSGNSDVHHSVDNFLARHQQQDSSAFDNTFFDQPNNDHYQHYADPTFSLQEAVGASPVPLVTSEYPYIQQESTSVASSSPSMDVLSPSALDPYLDNNLMMLSCSPQDSDLPLFPATLTTAPIVPSQSPLGKQESEVQQEVSSSYPSSSSISTPKAAHHSIKSKSGRSSTIPRTLSYESVMSLEDLSPSIHSKATASPPPPSEPLDHDKVMEALRAKLRRSSSPYQGPRRKPSPEPVPPPNTYPTTGVLLLNLKNRRRKTSITKRSNSNASSSSKP